MLRDLASLILQKMPSPKELNKIVDVLERKQKEDKGAVILEIHCLKVEFL